MMIIQQQQYYYGIIIFVLILTFLTTIVITFHTYTSTIVTLHQSDRNNVNTESQIENYEGIYLRTGPSIRSTTNTTSTSNRYRYNNNSNPKARIEVPYIQRSHSVGFVEYHITTDKHRQNIMYTRQFNIPCGYGAIVFNVGPAHDNEPYIYDIYDDEYAYSNNGGYCFLYPSYTYIQESYLPLWSLHYDRMEEQVIPLDFGPIQISTRILVPSHSKLINNSILQHGGDYVMISKGNLDQATFYEQLRDDIHHWS